MFLVLNEILNFLCFVSEEKVRPEVGDKGNTLTKIYYS